MKGEGLLFRKTGSGFGICHTSFTLWTVLSQVITVNCGMVNCSELFYKLIQNQYVYKWFLSKFMNTSFMSLTPVLYAYF